MHCSYWLQPWTVVEKTFNSSGKVAIPVLSDPQGDWSKLSQRVKTVKIGKNCPRGGKNCSQGS